MCFSAQVSFAASAVLMGTGAVALYKTKTPSQRAFASIPAIFSIQQFCEGLVWVSLSDPVFSTLHPPAMYAYILIAMVVWPFWVPWSVWLLEESPDKKKTLLGPLFLGALTSAYYLIFFFILGVRANIDCYHVQYRLGYPYIKFVELLYILAVVVPFFISSWRRMLAFGVTLLLSLAVSLVFYREFALSVWCFFAALLSVQILLLLAVPDSEGVTKSPLH